MSEATQRAETATIEPPLININKGKLFVGNH
jgi:hypothetical protein